MNQRAADAANDRLYRHVGDLTDLSTALIVLAELTPERITVAQTAFFLSAAIADIAGRPATFTELKEAIGPAIGRSLHSTYQAFLDRENVRYSRGEHQKGLAWLTRETNPADQRQKFLRLTPQGREIVAEVAMALTGTES
ncbi:hypothetical protein QQS45_08535 [Alteriqipengyuania flavescens]|uniref:hypothetical protein n=1 Tax=Alteriqipengyuania flavescens TaxID=3053610 RepID=UPI0025B2CE2B|nr:hypothetical protein [Alteriqipengyuania flavescens]WJY17693.1 hypothetical protein QQW98_08530 [Alteriqipengyuania flavescens]WJY23636.1 hypothetical protein QQS45_08535 [Alteriqipengyuania flavescens]